MGSNQYNVTEADHIYLLKYIRGYVKTYGYPPTIREMMASLELASTCPTRRRLEMLEERGWIQRTKKIPRGLRITNKGYSAIAQHDRQLAASMEN